MTFGKFNVDYEQRIYNPERMRQYRLERAHAMLKKHGFGSMLILDYENQRYFSWHSRKGWNRHRLGTEVLLLIRDEGYPYAPTARSLSGEVMPWYEGKLKLTVCTGFQRGGMFSLDPKFNAQQWTKQAEEIKGLLKSHNVLDEPCGLDLTVVHMMDVFRNAGINIVSGTEALAEARMIKNQDEIECLRIAGSITEAAHWEVCKALRPGMTEMQVAGIAAKALYDHGGEDFEGPSFVVMSGPRAGQNIPRQATDRVIRPGEMVVVDLNGVSFQGYRTCFYRTFCVGDKPTEFQKEIYQATLDCQVAMETNIRLGRTNRQITEALMKEGEGRWYNGPTWPEPGKYWTGGLGGHELGLASGDIGPGWGGSFERPESKQRIEKGRVFAVEVGCSEWDGKNWSYDGAKLENVVAVTDTGTEVLYRFPYKDLITVGLPGIY